MPPVRHRLLQLAPENTWYVGSDDFTLPSLFAIVSRLILMGLTVGTIVYLLVPTECPDGKDEIPPLLYISLFIFNLVLFLTIINEGAIFSVSLRGRIDDTENSRKYIPLILEIRVALMIIELLTVIVATIGVFSPSFGGNAIQCEDYRDGPLVFAKVIVCFMWVLLFLLVLAMFFAVDPLGLCSPSLLGEIDDLGDLGRELDEEGFLLPGKFMGGKEGTSCKKRKYHVQLGHRKVFRRFKALCCCFTAGTNRSSSLAMQDAAKAFHTIFSNLDFVPSDVVAGLLLLKRDQRKKKEECMCPVCTEDAEGSCQCLTKELKDLTFEHMPEIQKPTDYIRHEQRPFNFDDPMERSLFEDVLYYMHYSMGIYGWALHVFQNPLTGLCKLSAITCCRCHFRCWNPRAGVDFVKDDMCLCGVGTMRVQSMRQEEDIVFASYENQVYQTPFSISVDHDRKTVVLAIRGTLSMKDALTDMSVTMVKVKIPGLDSEELYMHNGMYRTAQWIKSRVHTRQCGEAAVMSIRESHADLTEDEAKIGDDDVVVKNENRQILRNTMETFWHYQLIVAGHSLGAGVASILAVLLKPAYPNLHCYAYSPPGCIFSMPVAHHSESFITTVVLGNDLVPRTSFRSLLYMKKQVEYLVKSCKKPKPQVLFQRPLLERLFSKVTENPTVCLEDVKEGLVPDKKALGIGDIVLAKKFAKKAKARLKKRSTIHVYIKNINQGDHIASFPPGRILHMEFTKSAKPLCLGLCYPSEMKLTWKSFEDFSTITVDKGMVEDHLPTAVFAGLKRIKRQYIYRNYDPEETEAIRDKVRNEYRQRAAMNRGGESLYSGSDEVDTWKQRVSMFEDLETRESRNGVESQKQSLAVDSGTPHSISVAVTLEDTRFYSSGDNGRAAENGNMQTSTSEVKNDDVTLETSTAATIASKFVQTLTQTSPTPISDDVALEMEVLSQSPEFCITSTSPNHTE